MLGISGGEQGYPIGLKFFGGTVGPNVMADDNLDDYRASVSWATTPRNSGFWPYSLATLTTVLHYRADCENVRHFQFFVKCHFYHCPSRGQSDG